MLNVVFAGNVSIVFALIYNLVREAPLPDKLIIHG